MVEKSPRDTLYTCNVTNHLLKKRCRPFKNALLFPLLTQYNVETQEKLWVLVFNIGSGDSLFGVCA